MVFYYKKGTFLILSPHTPSQFLCHTQVGICFVCQPSKHKLLKHFSLEFSKKGLNTLYILFTSSSIISQKEKCTSLKFCMVSREYCATSVVLLSLRCTVKKKSTHFITAVHVTLPPSAEEPHFTGVSANSNPLAFPSSAKGKGTKIAVQKRGQKQTKNGFYPKTDSKVPAVPSPQLPRPPYAPGAAGGGRSPHASLQVCPSSPTPGQGGESLPEPDTGGGARGRRAAVPQRTRCGGEEIGRAHV